MGRVEHEAGSRYGSAGRSRVNQAMAPPPPLEAAPASGPLHPRENCARIRPRAGARGPSVASKTEVQMITKTIIRPYKGTDQWEADVFMLVDGKEVRRRWRSPMPSKLATERWAREKAKGFLADYGAPASQPDQEEEAPPKPAEFPPLRDYAVRWIDEYVIANRHSTATVEGRQKCLKTHLLPLLGDMRIDQIGPAEYQKIRQARKGQDANSVNKICDQLTTMLNVAVEWKLIKAAPKVKRLKAEQKEMAVLTPEEGEKLVDTALEFGAKFHLAALLGVDGGLRNSEIIGLRWSDINFDRGEIVVQNRIWNGQEGPPKARRTVGSRSPSGCVRLYWPSRGRPGTCSCPIRARSSRRTRPSGNGSSRSGPRPRSRGASTRCATPSPRTPSTRVSRCGRSRPCSATRASSPPSATCIRARRSTPKRS